MITIPIWLILVVASILILWISAAFDPGPFNIIGLICWVGVFFFWIAWLLRGCVR